MMKKSIIAIALMGAMLMACTDNKQTIDKDMTQELNLTQEWDKVFPQSDKVDHKKVTFHNRYGITLVADMYTPLNPPEGGKYAAIAVSGPYGAVKEQVSGLYAQHMAERGFLTIAFDPSFTGESGGEPRSVSSPDINTEDFSAAVDFLSVQENVDPERIGIIGICGWGGMAVNAAAMDTRIKGTVAVTMYDMSRVMRGGYNDVNDNAEARREMKKALNAQRTEDYRNGTYASGGGNPEPETLTDDTPQFLREYVDYYKTPRGYHKRSLGSNEGFNATVALSWINQPLLQMAREIDSPVLLVHGEKAHSRYFSEGAFEAMTGQKPAIPDALESGKNWSKVVGNKELYIIPGAVHTALYDDRAGVIPYDKLEAFFRENLR